MEEKALRLSAVFLMILTAVSFVLLPKLPALHTWEVEAREERIAEEEFAQSQVTMQNLKIKEQNEAAGAKGELSIRLPEGVTGDQIAVSNDYVTQTIRVEIPQADRTYFDSYPVLGNSDYIDTAITQNIKDLLASREVENIFENSDFVLMLNQAQGDRAILAKQLNISPQQMKYVTHTEAGEGLIFYGNVVLPFVDHFPKDTELYRIMTTKPEEVSSL